MSASTTNQDLEFEEISNETTSSSSDWESASDEETTTTTSPIEEEVISPATSTSTSPSLSNRKRRRDSDDDGEEERQTTLPRSSFSLLELPFSAITISSRRTASISSRRIASVTSRRTSSSRPTSSSCRTASSSSTNSTSTTFTIFEDPMDRIIDLVTPPSSPRLGWVDETDHRETIRSDAEERRLMEIQIHYSGYNHYSRNIFRHDNNENDARLPWTEYYRHHDRSRDGLGDDPYMDGRGAFR